MRYSRRWLLTPLLTALAASAFLALLTVSAAQAGPDSNPSGASFVARGDHALAPTGVGNANAVTTVRASTAYSFTGYTLITPTIDGVFSGTPVDYDGTATTGAGTKTATTPFIELKPFDVDDDMYFDDNDFSASWSGGDSLWVDNNGNGSYDGLPDLVIIGTPTGIGVLLDGATPGPGLILAFNDVEHEDARADNNRYDDGEDIYVVDDLGEFRGGQHILVPDPDGTGPPIAHAYWVQDADYIYFHNDFLTDADTTFFGGAGTPATAGFIDGDGITSAGTGTPDRIRTTIAATAFFSTTDRVAWFDADGDSTWSPAVDALWRDSSTSVPPTYASATDSVIVYAGGTLTEGLTAYAWLSPDTYDFAYHDDNLNSAWNSGEDIWAHSGDEQWDYNYFDNELNWLIDGDGSTSAGRGTDEPARYDGNTWFQAADRVYWFDSTGNGEWNPAADGLWQDANGNGTYQSGTDKLLYAGTTVPENSAANMRLLRRIAVDGDGFATTGAGSASDYDSYRADKMPRPFAAQDDVVWLDADNSYDWTAGDALWHDADRDATYTGAPDDTVIVISANLVPGVIGTRLTFANHWIGYHDGEVTYNGAYDSGEDIYASNSYFSYDDFEITPDHRYTDGEDVYDRDWLEIWVYAEGENTTAIGDPPESAPDYEPALRDVGFRVHLNGTRIDAVPPTLLATRTISDYDAPFGIQAATGWGPSRGFVGPILGDPMLGVYNRHYEYRLPRRGALSSMRLSGQDIDLPQPPVEEILDVVVLPDCSIWFYIRWKDIRRARNGGGFAGDLGTYATSSGEGWVFQGEFVHPEPEPPVSVNKNDISDPILSDAPPIPGSYFKPSDAFFDVFLEVPYDPGHQPTTVEVHTELIGLDLIGYMASSWDIQVTPTGQPGQVEIVNHTGDTGWAHVYFAGSAAGLPADSQLDNTATVTPPDGDPTTSDDSSAVNPRPKLIVSKQVIAATSARPGEVVTYEVIYGNAGLLALEDVRFTDTLPMSTTGQNAYPNGNFDVDSFFDITYRIDVGPLLPGRWGRAQMVVALSPTVVISTRITNTITGTYFAPLLGTYGATGAELGLKVEEYRLYLPLVLRQ